MYKKWAFVTIGAVFFLILVGGIVRATGSGMGCPDWPKCFGSWIPPTHVDQLPVNYQEIFGAKLKGEVEFNVFKTWTEYVNRLVGVLIGFLIFGTFIAALIEYRSTNRKVIAYSLLAFVLVALEGWLGSKVVSSELHVGLITLHMLLAIAVVFSLIYSLYLAFEYKDLSTDNSGASKKFLVWILMILSFGQLIMGTQIRESIDEIAREVLDRNEWIALLEGSYYVHIGLGIMLLLASIWFYRGSRNEFKGLSRVLLNTLLALILFEFSSGLVLGVFGVPAWIQPIHLTLATIILGIEFGLVLIIGKER